MRKLLFSILFTILSTLCIAQWIGDTRGEIITKEQHKIVLGDTIIQGREVLAFEDNTGYIYMYEFQNLICSAVLWAMPKDKFNSFMNNVIEYGEFEFDTEGYLKNKEGYYLYTGEFKESNLLYLVITKEKYNK